jgi:hypothetical protein
MVQLWRGRVKEPVPHQCKADTVETVIDAA